jgi:hypothetical protein
MLGHVWQNLDEFSTAMSESEARALATEPDVEFVEQDQRRIAPNLRATRASAVHRAGAPAVWY